MQLDLVCRPLVVKLKKPQINNLQADTGIFAAGGLETECCWILPWVIGVREFDLTSKNDEDISRGSHACDPRTVPYLVELDSREGEGQGREGAFSADSACSVFCDAVHN